MTAERPARRHLTIVLVPHGGQGTRTFRVSYARLRIVSVLGALLALCLALMIGSWWHEAARASTVGVLERQLADARSDSSRAQALGYRLDRIERQYAVIRHLFGPLPESPSDLWLPPPEGARERIVQVSRPESSLPRSWPLTEPGVVTQGLLEGAAGQAHPGLDIATATGSYIRAAGAGTVLDVGQDSVYGRYVVIAHGDGYTSLYAHASLALVTKGEPIRRGEVIALSGSTGRSTAPHLHFEIRHDGKAVDPLTMLVQP